MLEATNASNANLGARMAGPYLYMIPPLFSSTVLWIVVTETAPQLILSKGAWVEAGKWISG